MGPSVILDKSALEALSLDEAVWLEALLDANVVPTFYVEVLADLEKPGRQGQTPDAAVSRLAEKTPSNASPNVHHRKIVLAELAGQPVAATHRPMIEGGDIRRAPDGRIGHYVDEFPEQTALWRWQRHEFDAVERHAAKRWRAELAAQDLEQMIGLATRILPNDRKLSDLGQLNAFIDEYCARRDREVLTLAMAVLGLPERDTRAVRKRWEKARKPTLPRFAPYATYVVKVDLLFYLGIARGFISGERASNAADMDYLHYPPSASAFASGDGLHRRTVPLFLDDDQMFLTSDELKAALREFDAHYEQLPEDIKALGVMSFAMHPPSTLENAVTRLWDRQMRPDWRELAARHEAAAGKPRDEAADRRTVDELNARIDDAEMLPGNAPGPRAADPDFTIRRRYVRATKGKWRMVSADVENVGCEH